MNEILDGFKQEQDFKNDMTAITRYYAKAFFFAWIKKWLICDEVGDLS